MISFKCITYARVSLLEEALFSFLQLEDNDSELVIVNDYPLQELVFDHPQVKIFNLKETFSTIGDKENYAIERCSGDIIGVFDDDDVCMPWHLKNIKKYWKPDTNMLHWARGVYYNEPNITEITYIGNSGVVYSKKAWEAIGRSPIMNGGGDSILRGQIHALGQQYVVDAYPPNNEVSWFYRWAVSDGKGAGCYHQSGGGFEVPGRPDVIKRHSMHIEKLRLRGLIPIGVIELKPNWRFDYKQLLKDYVSRVPNSHI